MKQKYLILIAILVLTFFAGNFVYPDYLNKGIDYLNKIVAFNIPHFCPDNSAAPSHFNVLKFYYLAGFPLKFNFKAFSEITCRNQLCLPINLNNLQFPRQSRQRFSSFGLHKHHIFYPNPADSGDINTGLYCKHHVLSDPLFPVPCYVR